MADITQTPASGECNPPRPTWAYRANSILLIAASLFTGGILLGGFAHWDPCAWIGSFILLGPCCALATWQYRATFRANSAAAGRLFILSAPIAALFSASVVSTVVESKGTLAPFELILLSFIPGWFTVTTLYTLRWSRRLRSWSTSDESATSRRAKWSDHFVHRAPRVSLRELFAFVAALSLVAAGITLRVQSIPPATAMHVTAEQARLNLPEAARDVCVERGSRGTIRYEFAIDEAGFWAWQRWLIAEDSEASHIKVQPIDTTFSIYTCTEDYPGHQITGGWYYSWRDGDRGIHYAYDKDKQRAYYHAHKH